MSGAAGKHLRWRHMPGGPDMQHESQLPSASAANDAQCKRAPATRSQKQIAPGLPRKVCAMPRTVRRMFDDR